MRKEGPMLVAVVSGLVLIFSQYFHIGQVYRWDTQWGEWFLISTAFAFAVGFLNVMLLQVKKIQRRERNWWASIICLLVMFPYLALIVHQDVSGTQVQWMMNAVTRPVINTVFAMLAFFTFSAAYRALRVKSVESSLMMLAAAIGMFSAAPIGAYFLPFIEPLDDFIQKSVVAGSLRGVTIGAYLGAFAIAIRILLGLERSHISTGGE